MNAVVHALRRQLASHTSEHRSEMAHRTELQRLRSDLHAMFVQALQVHTSGGVADPLPVAIEVDVSDIGEAKRMEHRVVMRPFAEVLADMLNLDFLMKQVVVVMGTGFANATSAQRAVATSDLIHTAADLYATNYADGLLDAGWTGESCHG